MSYLWYSVKKKKQVTDARYSISFWFKVITYLYVKICIEEKREGSTKTATILSRWWHHGVSVSFLQNPHFYCFTTCIIFILVYLLLIKSHTPFKEKYWIRLSYPGSRPLWLALAMQSPHGSPTLTIMADHLFGFILTHYKKMSYKEVPSSS